MIGADGSQAQNSGARIVPDEAVSDLARSGIRDGRLDTVRARALVSAAVTALITDTAIPGGTIRAPTLSGTASGALAGTGGTVSVTSPTTDVVSAFGHIAVPGTGP